jgi:IS5 family transposase
MRDFVGIGLSRKSVPDATTLLKFRRLLLVNDLTKYNGLAKNRGLAVFTVRLANLVIAKRSLLDLRARGAS